MVHISIQYIFNYQIIQQMIKVLGFSYIKSVTQILDWLIFEKSEKVHLDFSHQILWKKSEWNFWPIQSKVELLFATREMQNIKQIQRR